MSPAGASPVRTPWTTAPADRDDDVAGRRGRVLRTGAPLVILAAVALLGIAVANVQVARSRESVERDLSRARSASALVPQHLAAADPDAVSLDLQTLGQASGDARHGSAGLLWALSGRVDPAGRQLGSIRRDVERSAALAAAARPLRRSLGALTADAGATDAGTGPAELDQLDDLARGLGGYASAAARVGDPSAPALERAAIAAGLLPDLAGAEGPRTWTVCRTATGPCTSATITTGELGPIADTPAGPTQTHDSDLLIVGVDPATLLRTAAVRPDGFPAAPSRRERANRRYLDLPSVFALLDGLGPADDGPAPIVVHSVVPVEQHALAQLTSGPA